MLKISVQSNLPSAIDKIVADFDKKQAALLQEIGQKLLSLQQFDFEKKSRRGASIDGTVWAPLAESTERRKFLKGFRSAKGKKKKEMARQLMSGKIPRSQIGVDTGIMRNCVVPGYKAPDFRGGGNILEVHGNSVTVGYARTYAEYFDQGNERQPARPLMPDQMPDRWRESVERIVEDWAKDIVSELWTTPSTQVWNANTP